MAPARHVVNRVSRQYHPLRGRRVRVHEMQSVVPRILSTRPFDSITSSLTLTICLAWPASGRKRSAEGSLRARKQDRHRDRRERACRHVLHAGLPIPRRSRTACILTSLAISSGHRRSALGARQGPHRRQGSAMGHAAGRSELTGPVLRGGQLDEQFCAVGIAGACAFRRGKRRGQVPGGVLESSGHRAPPSRAETREAGQLRVPAIERTPNVSCASRSLHVTTRRKLQRVQPPEECSRPNICSAR